MREIKFRAWQKYHKKMVEVTNISFGNDGGINGVSTFVENQAPQRVTYKDGLGDFFLTDEHGMVLELMQYTGLKDKNGVDIYEGDIVKAYRTCKNDLITFDNGSFGIALDDLHSFKSFTDFYGKCEVIGNKFENPELLEVRDEL